MVILENGLVRAMKSAYKGAGYTVACFEKDGDDWPGIYNGYWAAEILMKDVPRKVLGKIAEHAGKLPNLEEAYHVRGDEVQDKIFDLALKPLIVLDVAATVGNLPSLKRTELMWRGLRVWQREIDLKTVMVNTAYTQIADLSFPTHMVHDCIMISGEVSRAYICRVDTRGGDEPMIEHLDRMQWVAW